MFMISQVSGTLNDYAMKVFDARIQGNRELMVSLYREATGDNRPIGNGYECLPSLESGWWIYNVCDVIRQHINGPVSFHTSEQAYMAIAKLPGKWIVYPEY